MKWIRFLGASLSTFVIVLFISSYFMDPLFHVHVEQSIQSDFDTCVQEISSLPNWRHWMEQGQGSSSIVLSFDGPSSGPGATLYWNGKKTNGILRIEKEEIDPVAKTARIEFSVSMENGKGHSNGFFQITGGENQTDIIWEDHGSLGRFPLLRLLNPVMESALSAGYEKNLENLKARLEENH